MSNAFLLNVVPAGNALGLERIFFNHRSVLNWVVGKNGLTSCRYRPEYERLLPPEQIEDGAATMPMS